MNVYEWSDKDAWSYTYNDRSNHILVDDKKENVLKQSIGAITLFYILHVVTLNV